MAEQKSPCGCGCGRAPQKQKEVATTVPSKTEKEAPKKSK